VVGALTTVTSEFGRERDGYAYADLLPIQS
jgi:hypothetical protein